MFAIVILLLAFFVPAAQPAETWYWGLRGSEVVAFSANGEEQVIADELGVPQLGWRMNETAALYLFEGAQDTTRLYRLSDDAAAEISLPEGAEESQSWRALDHEGEYIVLWTSTSGVLPAPAFLVNTANATAEPLTGGVARLARFAGSKGAPEVLRYLSVDADEDRWTLLERDLASGEEREMYGFDAEETATPIITANSDGSQWLHMLRDDERRLVSTLINADGTTEILDDGSAEQPTGWQFFGDARLGIELFCEIDCQIVVQDGETEQVFTIPEASLNLSVLAHPENGSLVVYNHGRDMLLVTADNAPLLLGEFNPQRMLSGSNFLSPDKRFIFSSFPNDDQPDTTTYFVTDLTDGIPVLTAESTVGAAVNFSERGAIMLVYNRPSSASAYLYDADQSIDLRNVESGVYFDILADGALLYMLTDEESEIGAPGIYRYNPENESYTLLVEGARVIYTPPVPVLLP